jgi:hypothetical protein
LDQNAKVDESVFYIRGKCKFNVKQYINNDNDTREESEELEKIKLTHIASCDVLKRIYSQSPTGIRIEHTNSIQTNLNKFKYSHEMAENKSTPRLSYDHKEDKFS